MENFQVSIGDVFVNDDEGGTAYYIFDAEMRANPFYELRLAGAKLAVDGNDIVILQTFGELSAEAPRFFG